MYVCKLCLSRMEPKHSMSDSKNQLTHHKQRDRKVMIIVSLRYCKTYLCCCCYASRLLYQKYMIVVVVKQKFNYFKYISQSRCPSSSGQTRKLLLLQTLLQLTLIWRPQYYTNGVGIYCLKHSGSKVRIKSCLLTFLSRKNVLLPPPFRENLELGRKSTQKSRKL